MKVGDIVRVHAFHDVLGSVAIVTKVHDGRQKSVDIMTPWGMQKSVWVNHLEVIDANR